MSVKTRNIIIGFGIWAIIIATIMYVDLRKKAKIEAKLDIEYPRIKIQDSFDHLVKGTFLPEGFRHNPYFETIEFKNNEKASLHVQFLPNQPTLQKVIKPGTHIFKKSGCDTIWVQNTSQSDTLKLFFLMRNKGE